MRKTALLLLLLLLAHHITAYNVTMYFFYSTTCPHCHAESIFLSKLEAKYPSLEIKKFAVDISDENLNLMTRFARAYKVSETDFFGVPQTYVGDGVIIGYMDDDTTGRIIEERVANCIQFGCIDPYTNVLRSEGNETTNATVVETYVINYPFIGKIDMRTASLPLLSILLGLLDGFNPCAMWVLIYLITMLTGTKDRKKMILIVGTFVFASGVWYILILSGWLKLWEIISFTDITRVLVGIVAVGAGLINLKDYITLPKAVCKVTDAASQSKIMKRIDELTKPSAVPATLFGIVLLAFTVNTVEFACSAGFPATFTRILALRNLPFLEYYLYILIYVFFYMLDDMIVFSMAVITLSSTDFGSKYGKLSQLIGGVVLLILGLLLIFMPQVLT
ncbi:MAG: hypothetical protein QXF56_05010 [Candidatus Micrarchaeia archaeon]